MVNRRILLQSAATAAVMAPNLVQARQTGSRDLVTHTVHEGLRQSSPLLIYSGLNSTVVTEPLLLEAAGADDVPVEVWEDWNDHDLHRVFGAFIIGTPEQPLGSYRIFDTPDIAWADHQPMIEEAEQGYFVVGGMRASRIAAGGIAFASMRLWNVIITGIASEEDRIEDVMLGLVKHLGHSIGALE